VKSSLLACLGRAFGSRGGQKPLDQIWSKHALRKGEAVADRVESDRAPTGIKIMRRGPMDPIGNIKVVIMYLRKAIETANFEAPRSSGDQTRQDGFEPF
jgi:hypothetical protein